MHEAAHLQLILILLLAAVGIVAACRLLRLSPVIGYLAAGVAIGPQGMALVEDVKTTSAIAEFGVIFLLFMIGLELSLDRLKSLRHMVFGLGTAQMLACSLIIGFAALALGMNGEAALIIGGGLGLSSTAIVLQVLEESGKKSSQIGRLSFAVLLLQDLAVVPLLVLVPLLAQGEESITSALGEAALKAALALTGIFIVGRKVLRPLFHFIANFKNPEMFLATVLLTVLGMAWLSHAAGLSLALGAFVAGLLMAETEFQHQVEADIKPAKGLFLGLFFMAVGMSVDLTLLTQKWAVILALTASLMLGKALLIGLLFRAMGIRRSVAFQTGILLSQGGEFAFVLFNLAGSGGVISNEITQILLVTVTISMALTPLAVLMGHIALRFLRRRIPEPAPPQMLSTESQDLSGHVIVAGFGRMGQTVAKILMEENVSFVALDMNTGHVNHGKRRGKPVYFADATRTEILRLAGAEHAAAGIVTVKDEETAERVIMALRTANPDMPIIARARTVERVRRLEALGASVAIAEVYESSLQIGALLLQTLGTPSQEINRIISVFRELDYARAEADLTPDKQ